MMKKHFLLSVGLIAFLLFLCSCGSSGTDAQPETTTTTYDLMVDDGIGVIFMNYDVNSSIPAQFKLYDNDLRIIMNGDTFPGSSGSSNYQLKYVKFMLSIFGLSYHGTTIDKIVCEKSNNPDYQLRFGYYINGDGDPIDNNDGIPWQDLVDVQGAPIVQDMSMPCTGGGRNFTITLFRNYSIDDEHFTLYFDFKGAREFRGKIVVTETGKDPSTDGVVLFFE